MQGDSYNLRYPGQYYMAETGLNQNWNRDYDPVTGKYIESDPIRLRGGVNTYGVNERARNDKTASLSATASDYASQRRANTPS